jgi:hypothetical protein
MPAAIVASCEVERGDPVCQGDKFGIPPGLVGATDN